MHKSTVRLAAITLLALPATLWSLHALAAPSQRAKTRIASLPKTAKPRNSATKTAPLPRYVPIATIKKLQAQNRRAAKQGRYNPLPVLQPTWEGHALKTPMRDLLSGPTLDVPPVLPRNAKNKKARGADPLRIAQAFPRPIAPASPRSFRPAGSTTVPRWVRYPLEFQLAGIGIGTRAVDKDRFNRIDRYGLFALHGNPTAVVRSIASPTTAGATGPGGAPEAGGAAGAPAAGTNLTLQQTPPETAALFPQSQLGGGLPDWALAVTVKLDNNHVEWLYKRENYSMGFVVDRLGFVDAIIVAGLESDITRTQLEDPVHTVKLGDDLRKVLFRYGYPDDVVPLAADPAATANDTTGAPGGAAAAGGGGAEAGGGGAAGAGAAAGTNGAFRTFDLRYEQSYNVVFTIRNNRVVRIYIFGDPDFFSPQRRNDLRTKY
ncbi:MAG TPA: hypothetical protein VGB45_09080 [Abditibacterium sp.]|jgi:hypothetical protein